MLPEEPRHRSPLSSLANHGYTIIAINMLPQKALEVLDVKTRILHTYCALDVSVPMTSVTSASARIAPPVYFITDRPSLHENHDHCFTLLQKRSLKFFSLTVFLNQILCFTQNVTTQASRR
jgi:hypothetical protein